MLTDIINQTTIKMDYKVHLKSQYITNRISELAAQPLEIGFLYGGEYSQKVGPNHEINISDIYLPIKQKISPATFNFEESSNNASFTRPKRIVGVGHSHANMSVFHSSIDYAKFEPFTKIEGIDFSSYKPKVPAKKETLKKHLHTYKLLKKQKPTQILTSFIYNMKNEIKTGLLAVQNYTDFSITENVPITYYNKKAVLTIDEKKELDLRIMKILKYNNITIKK